MRVLSPLAPPLNGDEPARDRGQARRWRETRDERCQRGDHDFVMAGIETADPSVDICTRCGVRRY